MKQNHHIIKDNKRRKLFKKYELKRKVLKSTVLDENINLRERFFTQLLLTNLPKNSSVTRIKNRCVITGRSQSVYRKFKLSRIQIKSQLDKNNLAGLKKISW
jgi:succinate dehydrogenase (ubiquinone) iron-sulfur subunit